MRRKAKNEKQKAPARLEKELVELDKMKYILLEKSSAQEKDFFQM